MKKQRWNKFHLLFYGFGLAVTIYIALLIAPYMENGFVSLAQNLNSILESPFKINIGRETPKTVVVSCLVYLFCTVLYISSEKNYRRGKEHGSSHFENPHSITNRLSDKKNPLSNRILSQNLSLSLNTRKTRRNLFTMVVGGSGAGKTRFYCKPNIMQCNTSMIITDPKGENLRDTGALLKSKGYKIKVFDLINMESSFRYNPFVYIKDDNDIQKLVTNIFNNTTDKKAQKGDQFWDSTAKMLLSAIMYLLWHEAPEEEQNFEMVMELIRSEDAEDEESPNATGRESPLGMVFDDLRRKDYNHIAVVQFDLYRKAAGKTIKSILISLVSRLEKFTLESIRNLTITDELELEKIGEEKTALFIVIPDNDTSFNFLVGMLYTQLFQMLVYMADNKYKKKGGRLPVPVHFILDEFANIALPDDFQKLLSTVRSREISMSIILQNIAQLKSVFRYDWESIIGNCDEFVFLGGNEPSSHEYVAKLLGKETIDITTYGQSKGKNGSSSQNFQNLGRDLLDPSEVRLKDKLLDNSAIVFIANEYPVIDKKYDLMKHPNIKYTADGGGEIFEYATTENLDKISDIAVLVTDYKEEDVLTDIEVRKQRIKINKIWEKKNNE